MALVVGRVLHMGRVREQVPLFVSGIVGIVVRYDAVHHHRRVRHSECIIPGSVFFQYIPTDFVRKFPADWVSSKPGRLRADAGVSPDV
jgi:hypothetical protein